MCRFSSTISKIISPKSRKRKEREALRSPLVRQRATQQVFREHQHIRSSVSSQMDQSQAQGQHLSSSFQFSQGSTSENPIQSSVGSQMGAQIDAIFGDQTQEPSQYLSSSFQFSEGSTSELASRRYFSW